MAKKKQTPQDVADILMTVATMEGKKKKKEATAEDIADRLEVVRLTIADNKKIERELTAHLLEKLHAEQKDRAGNYKITKADTYKVIAEELALPFALQRGLTKIDTSKVKKVFQLDNTLRFVDPATLGFEVVTQEKISPMKGAYGEEE